MGTGRGLMQVMLKESMVVARQEGWLQRLATRKSYIPTMFDVNSPTPAVLQWSLTQRRNTTPKPYK